MDKRNIPPPQKFRRYKAGEFPSAGNENKQGEALERLTRFSVESDKTRPYFKFMRLDEVVGQFGQSDSHFWDQEAVAQYFDPTDHILKDTSPEDRRRTLTSPWPECPYDADQVVLCIQTAQAGVYMPIAPVTVRHAMTIQEEGGTYPPCDDAPNVYPIKFTKKTWTKVAGRQVVTTTYLDPSDVAPDDYVLNIHEGENSYLPAGTEIQVYCVVDRWYTCTCCGEVCESSSSSSRSVSSSYSSQSASSQSSSSNSSSSQSSQSSSSRSSQSRSSGSSSSQSSSASSNSVSSSSSSQSSVSVSASSASSQSASSVSASASSASSSLSSVSVSFSSVSLSGSFRCYDVLVLPYSFQNVGGVCTFTFNTERLCFNSDGRLIM